MNASGIAPASSKSPLSSRSVFKRIRRRWNPAWRRRHRSRLRRERVWAFAAHRRRRKRLRLALTITGVAGLALVVVAALGYRDLRGVRAELAAARQTLQIAVNDPRSLQTADGRLQVRAQVDAAITSVGSARLRLRRSVPLSLTSVVPGLGTQRSGLLRLVDDARTGASVGRDLLAQVDALAGRSQLRGGAVPVDGIRELNADLVSAAGRIGTLNRTSSGLWGPVGDARRRFDEMASSSASRLSQGAGALSAATTFVGADSDRRYLIAVENNAEMRDQGAVLQYVVVRFTGRRLVFERNGSVGQLPLSAPAPTPLPPGTNQVFGPIQPTRIWQSVNGTADFALSGQAMADMYRQATGQGVDGVIAVDVPGLASLLKVVGPITTEGFPEPVSAANATQVLLHDQYGGLPPGGDSSGRRERLGEVTHAIVTQLTQGSYDAVALGRELGDAAGSGHVRLWSSVANEEQVFERTGLGGGPATVDADRTFHLAVENRGATKLDYYVKPAVHQEIELSPQGTAVVRTTVVVKNQAPAGAPPSYQLGPDGVTQKAPGDYLAWLLLWGPKGSMQAGSVSESGLELSQHVIEVDAGQSRELTFDTVIPHAVRDGRLALRLVPQARFEPMELSVHLNAPGWSVSGPATWQGPWDRTLGLSWRVAR